MCRMNKPGNAYFSKNHIYISVYTVGIVEELVPTPSSAQDGV